MNFISRIIKSINAMRERLKIERHEAMYGPHFNEECALKAVSKMENEDGSRGEHWSLEETTSIANQYGINLKGEKYNKYDWYVALNMIRSDYYRAVVTIEIILGNAHNVRSPLRGSLTVQWTSFCCLCMLIIFPRFAQSSFASLGNIIIKLFKKGYQFLLRSVSKIL